jgi:type VI secretion system protein ImpK
MDAMYRACAEMLLAAARLGEQYDPRSVEALRQEVLNALRDMVSRCRAAGIPDTETAEARYAIVAFIDERILQSNWPGRTEWMSSPLQLQLYREYTAGENFFARMRALLNRTAPSPALEVYYLCLALGFSGAASAGAGGAHAARSYQEAARELLTRSVRGAPLSPHALPTDTRRWHSKGRSLAWPMVFACAAVGLIGLGALSWSLHRTLDRVTHDVTAADAVQAASAPGGSR